VGYISEVALIAVSTEDDFPVSRKVLFVNTRETLLSLTLSGNQVVIIVLTLTYISLEVAPRATHVNTVYLKTLT
jgi:hypothetical protein